MRNFKWLLFSLLFCVFSVWAKVNINTASVDELKTLKGIGESKAERIVAYRKAHGPFASAEALLQVKGIGPKILEKNRDEIEVSGNNKETNAGNDKEKTGKKAVKEKGKKDNAERKNASSVSGKKDK